MNDQVISYIRTYVPIGIGAFISFLAVHGIHLGSDATAGLVVFLTALFQALYYLVVHGLERRFPKLGWLVGYPAAPSYAADSATPDPSSK